MPELEARSLCLAQRSAVPSHFAICDVHQGWEDSSGPGCHVGRHRIRYGLLGIMIMPCVVQILQLADS